MEPNWEHYLETMAQERTCATFTCMIAAAEIFGAEISIINYWEVRGDQSYIQYVRPKANPRVRFCFCFVFLFLFLFLFLVFSFFFWQY
jgi:hypothetical protein